MILRLFTALSIVVGITSCCDVNYCNGFDTYPIIYANMNYENLPFANYETDIYDEDWNFQGTMYTKGDQVILIEDDEAPILNRIFVIRNGNQNLDTISAISYDKVVNEEVCNPKCWGKKNRETNLSFSNLKYRANGRLIEGNEVTFPL